MPTGWFLYWGPFGDPSNTDQRLCLAQVWHHLGDLCRELSLQSCRAFPGSTGCLLAVVLHWFWLLPVCFRESCREDTAAEIRGERPPAAPAPAKTAQVSSAPKSPLLLLRTLHGRGGEGTCADFPFLQQVPVLLVFLEFYSHLFLPLGTVV